VKADPRVGTVAGQRVDQARLDRARALRHSLTPEEATLWARLHRRQLDGWAFRRQQVIAGFIADYYCAAAQLVVEVDGVWHDAERERDAERDAVLAERGIQVVRIPNAAIRYDLDAVLTQIRRAIALRQSPPTSA
jgi:very-short-patch-repair endonuclease